MFVRHTNPSCYRGSVAIRVGLCFLVVAVGVWTASLFTPDSIGEDLRPEDTYKFTSAVIPWAFVSGLVTMCGIASICSLSSLACVERQLVRAANSLIPPTTEHRGEVDFVNKNQTLLTPIIGNDPAVRGYNSLVHTIEQSRHPVANRTVSQLDDSAITHARAMRVLETAWVITDDGGVIRYHSPKANGLLNLGEYSEASLFDLLQINEPELIDRLLSRVRVVRMPVQISLNGHETHLDITRSRLRGRDGDCEGMVWLIEDRTSQTQVIRSRDDFLMAATHELRTPLTNLRAYAEALAAEDGIDIEDQKQFCNVIVSESVRMGRLVDQLLSMGQIEAGSLVIESREVDLHQILGDVESQVLGQAQEKHQSIQMEIADKLPTVVGDGDHLRSAINNLVGNAVKYTPEHGKILVRCHHPDPKPDHQTSATRSLVCIEIIDNGPGISEEDQSRIFEKFYRCQDSATSQRGNGLGLSLALEVARLHGGDIRLESRPNEGSHFILELPASGIARSGLGH